MVNFEWAALNEAFITGHALTVKGSSSFAISANKIYLINYFVKMTKKDMMG